MLVRFDHIARVIANADHKQSGLWTLMAAPVPSGKAQQNLTSGAPEFVRGCAMLSRGLAFYY